MLILRRLATITVFFVTVIFLLWLLPRVLNPTPPNREQREANKRWIDTSPSWLDRQTCRVLGLCGIFHVRSDPPTRGSENDDAGELQYLELRSGAKASADSDFKSDTRKEGEDDRKEQPGQDLNGVPDYVLKYAPFVHLYSGENFWPTDIADHIRHLRPFSARGELNSSRPLSLGSLHGFDTNPHSQPVFLTSQDDVESRPGWLHSHANRPKPYDPNDPTLEVPPLDEEHEAPGFRDGTTWWETDKEHPLRRIKDPRNHPSHGSVSGAKRSQVNAEASRAESANQEPGRDPMSHHKPDSSGYSKAPATLVLVDKGSGIVDAFWFFFYAYNLGQTVMGIRFGNHVGDWEHAMVRFESGIPRAVFFSEHEGGQAYAWQAVEKRGNQTATQRPVIYSAVGSHAMYATPGDHPYVLPFKMLKDVTDRGPLWDPAQNFRAYWYDYTATGDGAGLTPASDNPDAPTDWFHYEGRWGDQLYGLNDTRQWRLFGQYHYVTGPQGPKFKNLGRERVCQRWRCRILNSISEGRKRNWTS